MKVFNKENGVNKVYLQIFDINMIDYYIKRNPTVRVPQEYYEQVKIGNVVNDRKYIGFTSKPVINFIKSLSWIIDYDEVSRMSIEELIVMNRELKDKCEALGIKCSRITDNQKKQRLTTYKRLLEYKASSIDYAIGVKQGIYEANLPLVPRTNGFKVICGNYVINDSLDYRRILLSRVDGNPIFSIDDIPNGFIESAVPIIVMTRKTKNEMFKYYESERYLTDDRRFLVFVYTEPRKEIDIVKQKKIGSIGSIIKRKVG